MYRDMNRNMNRDRVKKEKLEEKQSQKGETEKVSGAKRVNISAGDDKIAFQMRHRIFSYRSEQKKKCVMELREQNRLQQNRT